MEEYTKQEAETQRLFAGKTRQEQDQLLAEREERTAWQISNRA